MSRLGPFAIPYLSARWLLNEWRLRRGRRKIRRLERELAENERARFGRVLTEAERGELYEWDA